VTAGALVGPVYGTIQTAAQPNITSLGILPSLNALSISATGIGATNLTIAGNANFTGATITGISVLGISGNLTAANVSATQFTGSVQGTILQPDQPNILTLSGVTSVGASDSTTIVGTLQTAAQPNVTSVGTLTSLSVTGNATAGSVYTNNYKFANGTPVAFTSVANTAEISANAASGFNVGLSLVNTGVAAGTYGNTTQIPSIQIDSKGRITSATTNTISTTLPITGNTGSGTVSLLTQSLSVVGGANISTVVNAQSITINSTETLSSVTGRGASTTVALTLANITVGNITPVANLTQNIGSSTNWFNNIYGTANHALYADLAEKYASDQEYAPGTVVIFGGEQEITTTTQFADPRVAGAISTDPAYLMNGGISGLPLALRGRVPCQVVGPVTKGDSLVTSDQEGHAQSIGTRLGYAQAVFAKSLETNLDPGKKVIEVVIL
jgi:hypothetical protein